MAELIPRTAEEDNALLRSNIKLLLSNVSKPAICHGCGCEIYFVKHLNGKMAPYTEDGLNHFANCPKAKNFRKNKS